MDVQRLLVPCLLALPLLIGAASADDAARSPKPDARSTIRDTFGLIPLGIFWFSDGVYVVRTPKPHERLLGARIDSINGRTIGELEALLMASARR